jgi:PAS domain-containing protein
MANHPALLASPMLPGFARWVDAMTAGQPIVGDVETFPPVERAEYEAQGIRSLAYYPIVVEGEWWGCVGFEDCDDRRAWTLSELDGARTAAAMLGAAITRQRQEERLRDAETRYRGVVERIPAVTYVDVSGPESVRMAFLSPQIEELLGRSRLVVRPRARGGPSAGGRGCAPGRQHRRPVRRGVPDATRRRPLGLGARHLDPHPGA